MPIAKIEPTGCTVHKGKVQLRFSFYLEPGDARYEEHHVQADGGWRDNPFHNHFVYVDANVTNAEIKQLMTETLAEFYGIWAKGEEILEAWRTRPLKSKRRFIAGAMTNENKKRCQNKVNDIIKRTSVFQVRIGATDGNN